MLAERKSKSMDFLTTPLTDADVKFTALSTRGHRRQSSIPKPPDQAPLFRNNALDRFYSKIPYPTKSAGMFYDILTGELRGRRAASHEPVPRGGLSNLSSSRTLDGKRRTVEGERERGRVASRHGSLDFTPVYSSPTTIGASHEHASRACQAFAYVSPSLHYSSLPTAHRRSSSFSSQQSTFLEFGSDMTDIEDCYSPQFSGSDFSFDLYDDLSSSEAQFKPLPRSILKECSAQIRRDRIMQSDFFRQTTMSRHRRPESWRGKGEGWSSTRSPTSPVLTNQSPFFRRRRFRRRPQVPLSEASDFESCDASTKSVADSVYETRRKRNARRTQYEKSFSAYKPSAKTDDGLDPLDMSREGTGSSGLDPYDWVQLYGSECRGQWNGDAFEKPWKTRHFRHRRLSRLFCATLDFSAKALMFISSAALAQIVFQQPRVNMHCPQTAYDAEDADFEAPVASFSSSISPLVATGPVGYSYPISLLDSMSDVASP